MIDTTVAQHLLVVLQRDVIEGSVLRIVTDATAEDIRVPSI